MGTIKSKYKNRAITCDQFLLSYNGKGILQSVKVYAFSEEYDRYREETKFRLRGKALVCVSKVGCEYETSVTADLSLGLGSYNNRQVFNDMIKVQKSPISMLKVFNSSL